MGVSIKGRKRFRKPWKCSNQNAVQQIDTPTMLVFDDSMILYSLPSQSLFQLLSNAVSNV